MDRETRVVLAPPFPHVPETGRTQRVLCALAFAASMCLGVANAGTVQLRGNVSTSISNLPLTRRAAGDKPLDLTIFFALRNQAALDKLLADQQDPSSPQYHRWLTPDEFAARFGPTQTDFSAALDWLHSQNVNIESADIKSRQIRFADTVAHAEQMFGSPILGSEDGKFFGNAWEPSIPARFDGVIAFIDGLDNLRVVVAASHADPTRGEPQFRPLQLASLLSQGIADARPEPEFRGNAFGPSDLHTFYDETPLLEAGVDGHGSDCIAFIELSDYPDAGVEAFDQEFSLPDPVVTRVFPTTSPGDSPTLLEFEAILDVEWAHAAAPGAALKVYIGNGSTVGGITATTQAAQSAVNDNSCGVSSTSLGSCGTPESFFPGVAGTLASQAASQGMTSFVASWDYGAAGLGGDPSKLTCVAEKTRGVNEISANPNVTSVGGTQATPNFDSSGNDVGFVQEQVWNDRGEGASGGGASAAYPKPDYQKGVTPDDGARDVPDVAALAGSRRVLCDL